MASSFGLLAHKAQFKRVYSQPVIENHKLQQHILRLLTEELSPCQPSSPLLNSGQAQPHQLQPVHIGGNQGGYPEFLSPLSASNHRRVGCPQRPEQPYAKGHCGSGRNSQEEHHTRPPLPPHMTATSASDLLRDPSASGPFFEAQMRQFQQGTENILRGSAEIEPLLSQPAPPPQKLSPHARLLAQGPLLLDAEAARERERAEALEGTVRRLRGELQESRSQLVDAVRSALALQQALDSAQESLRQEQAREGHGESPRAEDAEGGTGQSCEDEGSCTQGLAAAPAAAARHASPMCGRCKAREADAVILPCRHLSMCKQCVPRADECPCCSTAIQVSLVLAPCNR